MIKLIIEDRHKLYEYQVDSVFQAILKILNLLEKLEKVEYIHIGKED